MSIIFYYQPMSQPSRAVKTAMLLGKVEFQPKIINVLGGEARQPDYTNLFPNQTVPAIIEGDFKLFESHAILRYLATSRPSLLQYYPEDPKKRAQIDCYLDWHHSGLRQTIFFNLMIDSFYKVKFFGQEPPSAAFQEEKIKLVEENLAFFELFFLGGSKNFKYIANQTNISIADLSAYSELSTLQLINYDFSKFPKIQAWFENISKIPEIKQSFEIHYALVEEFNPVVNDFNKRITEL